MKRYRTKFIIDQAGWVIQQRRGLIWTDVGNIIFLTEARAKDVLEQLKAGDCRAFHKLSDDKP